MRKAIFALIGPSGCGKTALITEMLRRLEGRLSFIKSVTTRPRRSAEDDEAYVFLSEEEFERLVRTGGMVQHVRYAGRGYGNDRAGVDTTLASHYGICAWVEDGVRNFRNAGYLVSAIRIVPRGQETGRGDPLRVRDDEVRAASLFLADVEILNDFAPGGFARAADELETYIRSFIDAYDGRSD